MVHDLTGWVAQHADPWVYVVVLVVAVAECGALIGLVVPGETVMLAAGYLAWQGKANLVVLVLLAILGAIVGDSIGFELGRRYGSRLKRTWLGRRIGDHRWQRADRYMDEHGAASVFFARWVTGPKSVVPLLAGESDMPYGRFLVSNVSSGVLWGTFHVSVGYVAGPAYRTADRYVGYGGLVLVAAVVCGLVVWHWRSRRRSSEANPG
jgi:membrane protein DedA with SNARE-associated domain